MTEPAPGPATAGGLLRAAREKQGLHIAALAAAIKVTPRKLDALENNRLDELPDATFARALAQTVCRALKIDPRPVLDLLPAAGAGRLENVAGTLNTPFSERGARPGGSGGSAVRPMVWAGVVLLLAALVVYLVPATFWAGLVAGDGAATAQAPAFPASETLLITPAGEASATPPAQPTWDPAAGSAGVSPMAPMAPVAAGDAAASAAASPAAGGDSAALPASAPAGPVAATAPPTPDAIQIQVVQQSWVEARDAQGRVLVSRLIDGGERLQLDGALPIRLVIGNATGVELTFRQQRIDLPALSRDNVARLQLP